MSKVNEARQRADQARADLDAAEHEAARVDADLKTRRQAARLDVWRDVAESYDKDHYRQQVVDAGDELRRALTDTDLGKALTGYLAAIRREVAMVDMHRDAVAQFKPGGNRPGFGSGPQPRDANLRTLGGGFIQTWLTDVLARAVGDLADETVKAERAAFDARVKAAADAVT